MNAELTPANPRTPASSTQQAGHWADRVKTGITVPGLVGLVIVLSFIAGFGFWAANAPLSGAAIAQGTVAASGQNLRIQHLEGGLIREILVREGDVVTKDQPLMTLDPTEADPL